MLHEIFAYLHSSITAYELCDIFILAEISLLPAKFVGFSGENYPPKVKTLDNACLEGTSLRQTASIKLSCVGIGLRIWAVRVVRKEKKL